MEEAEGQKAPVQRFADRFTAYYLPLVLGIAVLTYFVSCRVLNAVALLVVACSCAIVMATPVVVLASVGTAARRGLLVKGGIALEQLARVDAVCFDKTGTLTFGSGGLARRRRGEDRVVGRGPGRERRDTVAGSTRRSDRRATPRQLHGWAASPCAESRYAVLVVLRPKRKVTYYISEDVLRAAKVSAAREDQADSELVERALRRYLGFDVLDRVWARSKLTEKEAMDVAVSESHAARRRKRAARRS